MKDGVKMATVKGPLMSLDASGSIGGAIVFSKWKGRNYVRTHALPANPKSAGQLSVRAMMKFLSQFWATLSSLDKATWESRAEVTNISPFNAYVKANMARWGTYAFPSQVDPAAESDTPGTILAPRLAWRSEAAANRKRILVRRTKQVSTWNS